MLYLLLLVIWFVFTAGEGTFEMLIPRKENKRVGNGGSKCIE